MKKGHYFTGHHLRISGDIGGLLVSVGYVHARQCICGYWAAFGNGGHRLADSSL